MPILGQAPRSLSDNASQVSLDSELLLFEKWIDLSPFSTPFLYSQNSGKTNTRPYVAGEVILENTMQLSFASLLSLSLGSNKP